MIYYAHFDPIRSFGIVIWGNVSRSQKSLSIAKAIGIMKRSNEKDSCVNLLKQVGVFPFKLQYFFSFLLFVVKKSDHFTTNYDSHNIPTQQSKNVNFTSAFLSMYQHHVHYLGVKPFNKLLLDLNLRDLPINLKGP
jgi:hypothetical protein